MQEDLSTERMAKLSAETKLRQLQVEHQKQAADLEDLKKKINTMDTKLTKSGSIGNSSSLVRFDGRWQEMKHRLFLNRQRGREKQRQPGVT